jgi:hypothetical protein
VHHFLALSLSLTYITSSYFVSFRFALRSSPLCSRPPDVYVYVASTVHSPGVVLHVPVTDTHNVCHFVREGAALLFQVTFRPVVPV